MKPGDGRPLKDYRWWQPLSRALFRLDVDEDGERVVYAVDVPYWQRVITAEGHGRAHLYRDGRRVATENLPTTFDVSGGAIEVRSSSFGMRRCHLVTDDGTEQPLTPDPRSAEGRRARFGRRHPALSRLVGLVSVLLLVVPIVLIVPQIIDPISHVPPIAERWGSFDSPVDLPWWGNALLALLASTASVERATRLRFNLLLDGAN